MQQYVLLAGFVFLLKQFHLNQDLLYLLTSFLLLLLRLLAVYYKWSLPQLYKE